MDEYARGISLFNQAKFFDAHEVLEDVWRGAPAAEKKFLQGMVQMAVAFHHHSTGNSIGMRSVLERAIRNLGEHPGQFGGIDLGSLLESLHQWRKAVDNSNVLPLLPRIETKA